MAIRLATFALAALATCIGAPAANASYMASYGNYYADPGETNRVTVSFDGTFVTIADSVPITLEFQAGYEEAGNCSQPSSTSVRCSYPHGYGIELGDGDDSFSFAGPAPPLPPGTAEGRKMFDVAGGDGNDVLNGSPYADSLDSSIKRSGFPAVPGGVDRVVGGGGDDELSDHDGSQNFIDGGPGDDYLRAGPIGERGRTVPAHLQGRNTLLGGSGKDRIEGGWGDDQIAGSSGRDHLFGDEGRDRLRGGSGTDTIDGGPDQDVADGGSGNDYLSASFHGGCGGPDTFIGGGGRDSLYIYCGRPTLSLRDGVRDIVDCGRQARPRRITADRKDRLRGRCARPPRRR